MTKLPNLTKLVALINLSSLCLMMVERLFLAVPWGCLRFVVLVFLDNTHLLFWIFIKFGQGQQDICGMF